MTHGVCACGQWPLRQLHYPPAMVDGMRRAAWRARCDADRLCVMGPVTVVVSGREHPIAGMAARLVTLLTCSVDRWVSVDDLIDALWAGAPPDSARPALHVHLGSVRRWLAQAETGATIERSAAGYRIHLGTLELDCTLMVELVEQAHDLLDSAPDEAIEILRVALSLRRGHLSGAVGRSNVLAAASQRLDASRLAGEEDLVESLLAVGAFQAAEAEATRLVAQSPYREVRWAQLMRARYLDNRPREALATYRSVRTLLLDELGIEPGPLLQGLERSVLMHDLVEAPSGRRRASAPGPFPPPAGPIIGRDAELASCSEALLRRRVVVMHGPPGVGKTRLAQEVCQSGDFDGSMVWVDLQAYTDPLRAVALALGGPPDSGLDHVCQLLVGWPSLLVLDNAEHVTRAVERLTFDLQRALPDLRILITSRIRLSMAAAFIDLKPLRVPEHDDPDHVIEQNASVQLLRDALADLAPTARLTRDELLQICDLCGGLPLALRLAAGELRALGTRSRVHLAGLAVSSRLGPMVRATLAVQPPSRHAVFASLSVLVGEFDAESGAAVAGVPEAEFIGAVVDLVDSGLVDMVAGPPARYRILPPLRDVATGELVDDGSRLDALDRLADHGIAIAWALGRDLRRGEPVEEYESRTVNIVAVAGTAMAHLAATDDAERALELAGRLDAALYTLGWWTEKNQLLDQALAIPGPPSARRARALALRGRDGVLSKFDLGRLAEAELMAQGLGEEIIAAYAAHLRGIGLWWRGEHHASLVASRFAVDRFSAADRPIEVLEARKFVGLALLQSGEVDEGLREQHETLAGFEQLGIAFHVAHSRALLGHSYRHLGDDHAAEVDLRDALDVCRRLGNRATAIHVHLGLGDIAADRGDNDTAQRHAAAAMELIARSRLRTYEPWAWTIAMRAALAAGDLERSLGCGQRAIATLAFAPGGDTARLALELADLAVRLHEPRRAARLIGVAQQQTEPREMPLPAPADQVRGAGTLERVRRELGSAVDRDLAAGRRCTVAGAAGDLLERPLDHLR